MGCKYLDDCFPRGSGPGEYSIEGVRDVIARKCLVNGLYEGCNVYREMERGSVLVSTTSGPKEKFDSIIYRSPILRLLTGRKRRPADDKVAIA